MRKLTILLFVVGLAVASCKTNFNVVHIKDSNYQIKKSGFFYSLPRLMFEVKLQIEKTQFVAGPYCNYANKYLGIENVVTENYTEYQISSVLLTPLYEPDPAAVFFVDPGSKNGGCKLAISNNGILTGYNIEEPDDPEVQTEINPIIVPSHSGKTVWFTDLTVKRNFSDIQDTTYRVIKTDSVYQKIPIINTKITSKDIEQKAEEAANFVIKLRKRRFKLETAQTEQIPDGYAMEKMIGSLNELEKEYIDLFIGKKHTQEEVYCLFFIPEKNTTPVILFWFSENEGVSTSEKEGFYPVTVEITNYEINDEISRFYNRQTEFSPKYRGLYYRIPGQANMKIFADGVCYLNDVFTVPQFGYLNFIDDQMMKNKNLQISFDKNSGALRSIK